MKLLARLFAAALLSTALCGCGSDSAVDSANVLPATAAITSADIPQSSRLAGLARPGEQPAAGFSTALPAPSLLGKVSSFTQEDGLRLGAEFDPLLPNNNVTNIDDALIFAPNFTGEAGESFDDVAYAVYSFTLPDYDGGPVRINFSWNDSPQGTDFFAALASFPKDRWDWFTFETNPSGIAFESISDFINASDQLFLVLALSGTDSVNLFSIQIAGQLPPLAVLESSVDSGTVPLSVDFNAAGSSDPDGSVQTYAWDFDGDGQFSEPGSEFDSATNAAPQDIIYSEPGSFDATVQVTDNDGNTDTATVQINATLGQPPVAVIQANPESGNKPLEVSFDASASSDPEGPITDFEWDFDGDGEFNESGAENAARGDATPDEVTYSSGGVFEITVRVTDNENGKDTESTSITVINTPPLADLQSDITEGDVPFNISFTAEASSDPGGSIVNYLWDFDGDLLFSEAGTPEESAEGNAAPQDVLFDTPGAIGVTVRVFDDDGAIAEANLLIKAHGWDSFEIDAVAGALAVTDVQLAVIDGKPAVVYIPVSSGGIRYGRSSTFNANKPEDWTFITVPGNDGSELSLAEVGTSPAIAAHRQAGGDLIYQRASGDGTISELWNPVVPVETTGNTGRFPSLYNTSSGPAILYWDSGNQSMRTATSADSNGDDAADWNSFSTIADAGGGQSLFSVRAFGMGGGNPATAYYFFDGAADHLRFERSADAFGNNDADWTTFFDLDNDDGDGGWEVYGLSSYSGNPAMVYYDNSTFKLTYRLATSSDGSAWGAPLGILDESAASSSVRFEVIDALLCLAYQTQINGDIMFIQATGNGNQLSDWADVEEVETTGFVGNSMSMKQVSGRPTIAYSESTANSVRLAIRY